MNEANDDEIVHFPIKKHSVLDCRFFHMRIPKVDKCNYLKDMYSLSNLLNKISEIIKPNHITS